MKNKALLSSVLCMWSVSGSFGFIVEFWNFVIMCLGVVGTQWAWRFLICERLVVFANFLLQVLLFVCLSLCWIYYNWFSHFSSSFLSLTLFQLRGHFLNFLQPFRWLFAPRYSSVKCSRPFSKWSFATGFCFSWTYFSVSALIYVFSSKT